MEPSGFLLPVAVSIGLLIPSALAQSPSPWRVFTAQDGLAETACLSVTRAANGDLLVRHPGTNAISIFDGFNVAVVPGPDSGRERVFASPGGQLWTVSPQGVQEFRDGQWTLHRLEPVATHFRATNSSDIPLLPVRQGRVLALLPDQLLQLTLDAAGAPRWEVLVEARALGVSTFTNLMPATDGMLLLLGRDAITRSAANLRNLTPEVRWETTRALPPKEVESLPLPPAELLPVSDRAVQPDGSVWYATAHGLARATPPLWRPRLGPILPATRTDPAPAERSADRTAREAARWNVEFRASTGDLWLGGEQQVGWVRGEAVQIYTSTNEIGPEQVRAFTEAQDGRIVCATPAKLWEFDGQNWFLIRGGFQEVHGLTFARNGTLWVAAEDGVHRFTRGAWVKNDVAEGLPAAAITNVLENSTGRIIAQTPVGNWEFEPGADAEAPRVAIPPTLDPRAQFREGESLIIEFTGRDRWNATPPDRLLFSQKLDDAAWSSFETSTEKLLPDLPTGRHLFLVRAMDRNGNLSGPAALEFTVVLPWYRETRLVIVLAGALVVALFFAGLALNRHRRLRLSYADVEHQVAERTRALELAQSELLHSQKMNALGTLAAGIAHDFNNILSIIKGSVQIIEDNPDDPAKVRTRVDRIKTVVQQGAGIVEAMLGFGRTSGAGTVREDVNQIVDDTLRLLGDRFLRGVAVQFDRGHGLPQILVIRDYVQQTLLNFIFNAAEAMERLPAAGSAAAEAPGAAGGAVGPRVHRPEIRLRTRLVEGLPPGLSLKPGQAPAYVEIAVTDTGEGITPENLPRIFEPFFTTKARSSQRGTGLGLSMAYELARKLEAGLAVESVRGQGSTFTLILPVH